MKQQQRNVLQRLAFKNPSKIAQLAEAGVGGEE